MIFLAALLGATSVSCASKPIDNAFAGKMAPYEETRTIVDYCESCHVHSKFKPAQHLAEVTSMYSKEPYRSSKDCKTCHWISRDIWNDIKQYTHFPKGRLVSDS